MSNNNNLQSMVPTVFPPETKPADAEIVTAVGSRQGRKPGGAPKGNRNSIRSGTTSFILGRFPVGGAYIARQIRAMRRQLEAEILKREGEVGIYAAAVINTACTHEARALLLCRWLRVEGESLPVLNKAHLLERVGTARSKRDECLKLLKLDVTPQQDLWGALNNRNQNHPPAILDAMAGQPEGSNGQ